MTTNTGPNRQIRLNRYLAESGICSRRDADQLIFDGVVTVNGTVINDPAYQLERDQAAVKVNKKRIFLQPLTYILMNKPSGVVSTVDDPEGRMTVINLLKGVKIRVYPVGRLDYNTTGALLLTNDGECALKLTHPRYGFEKTYHAKVSGHPGPAAINKLVTGVRMPMGKGRFEKSLPAKVRLLKKMGKDALLEISLKEGKQHQVKKMCQAVGHRVEKLSRVKLGFLTTKRLSLGSWRYLTPQEIERLLHDQPKTPISKSHPSFTATKQHRKKTRLVRKKG